MTLLNPRVPNVAGLEIPFNRQVAKGINARGVRLLATSTVDIDSIWPFCRSSLAGSHDPGEVLVGADIYDESNVVWFEQETEAKLAVPGINYLTQGSGWTLSTPAAYGVTAYQFVDEVNDEANVVPGGASTNYLLLAPLGATASRVLFQSSGVYVNASDGSAYFGSAQRCISIQVVVVCRIVPLIFANTVGYIEGILRVNGTDYGAGAFTLAGADGYQRLQFDFPYNPDLAQQWLNSDMAEFESGGSMGFGVRCAGDPARINIEIDAINLVYRLMPEYRVAQSYRSMPLGTSWRRFLLHSPLTGATAPFTKTSGHSYAVVFHLPAGGRCDLLGLDCAGVLGHDADDVADSWAGVEVRANPGTSGNARNGILLGTPTNVPPWTPTMCLSTDPSVIVPSDSQPYAAAQGKPVMVGETVRQEISTEGTNANYGIVTALVASTSDGFGGVANDDTLTVNLRAQAGNAILATTEITGDDVPADGRYHLVSVRFASPANLTAGLAVWLEFTSSSTVAWLVKALFTREPDGDVIAAVTAAAAAGQGGTTDAATYDAAEDSSADFIASIAIVPAAPATFVATRATVDQAVSTKTGTQQIPYAHLDWATTALSDFDHYTVGRINPTTGVTEVIAQVFDQSKSLFNDVAGPRGVAVTYRVRVVNDSGGFSAWKDASPVTITVGEECDMILSSNTNGDLMLGYQDEPGHKYTRVRKPTMHNIAGKDKPQGFVPLLEGRADVFARRLIVAVNNSAVTHNDREPFDPLVDLLEDATIPCVVVADGHGRVWYTTPQIDGLTYDQPGDRHIADVTFYEVDGPPITVTDDPWVP